ncbi:transglycosylase SLT domain-containing protein [Thiothrix winogradskyi]|uniref:Transglycosylase SLT domain-containing protein n=1 Tax=Thiothrix winogradskyi TaxID=96472 RepID=A0ABY3T324_9GAMM|nr:transglycosylase SLT domain-containing protein [Thiothrix winogradskyi]UJS26248.1 transglycosylase SLT domain-containing protein [Thiothrix winogradskyi]
MRQQYQLHTANAIDALNNGNIDVVRMQIRLAKLAADKRLAAKRREAKQQPAIVTTIVTEEIPPASWLDKPVKRQAVGYVASSKQTMFILLMCWSCAAALVSNALPKNSPTAPPPSTLQSRSIVSGYPVEGRITSGIGWRTHPVTKVRAWHAGVDIAAPNGTPLKATGDGTVTLAAARGACGYALFIDHGTQETRMCHLSAYAQGIKAGKQVKAGDIVGYVGNTGRSTGPHVHYEVRDKQQRKIGAMAYKHLINAAAEKHGVDPLLIQAVMWKESSFNPNASSGKAHGLMQLKPSTGLEVAKRLGIKNPDLFDPATSVTLGTAYLAEMLQQFGKVELALAAYNAGPGAVKRFNGIPPYPETRNYVTKIIAKYNQLRS